MKGDGWLSRVMGGQPGRWVATSGRWSAKQGDGWLQLAVRLLATAALWIRIQTYLKIQNGRHKQSRLTHSSSQKKTMINMAESKTCNTLRFSQVCTSICKIFKLKVKRADPMRTCLTFNLVCLTFFILSPGPFPDYLDKKFILDKLRDSLTVRGIF